MGPTAALLRGLLAEARRSPDGEAYLELAQGSGYRLAIAVKRRDPRAPRSAVVVMIDSPDRVGPTGRIPRGEFARVEASLAARGYVTTRLDNGWMAHERSVARSRIPAEWRFVRRLLDTHVHTDPALGHGAAAGGRARDDSFARNWSRSRRETMVGNGQGRAVR